MKSILKDQWCIKSAFLAAAFLFALSLAAQPVIFQQPLSPRIANYDIDVRLDAKTGVFTGKETLFWRNTSQDKITELQFHLYQNAFRNNKSSFMKESGKGVKPDKPEPEKKPKQKNFGFMDVNCIKLSTGEDLKPGMEFIHPDDDNGEDKTVMRVLLPKPLAPGQTIVVNIDFTARLPEPPVARSGALKEYFFASQWFPKAGVYIDGKWNCHQYHSHTEFFADFGVYNVKITVPKKNLVGATGVLVSRTDNNDGTATHFYHAEDVHDFAWTTSPNFLEFKTTQNNVEIRALVQKKHKHQGERHLEAGRLAVKYFEDWYGDYPYPNLTIVDPAPGGGETGGMEYPTIITAGTLTLLPEGIRAVQMVIIHEFGHNFWYALVANNEFEDSWLDEGINTYSEIQIMHDIYGAKGSMVDWAGIKVDDLQTRRYSYNRMPDADPIARNGWQYYNGASYGSLSYSKPALMLVTLENYLGKETMNKIMRAYFERFKFKHPKTKDFVNVASEVSGQNLDWFFNQALYSNVVLDYAMASVSSKEIADGEGYDFNYATTDKKAESNKRINFSMTAPETPIKKGMLPTYESVVKIRRLGGFMFPVEIEMTFEDNSKIREKWDGKDTWTEFKYRKPVKLVSATVDPDKKVPLDINWKNNTRTAKQPPLDQKKGGYFEMVKFAMKPE